MIVLQRHFESRTERDPATCICGPVWVLMHLMRLLLHSARAKSIIGIYGEWNPMFGASTQKNITGTAGPQAPSKDTVKSRVISTHAAPYRTGPSISSIATINWSLRRESGHKRKVNAIFPSVHLALIRFSRLFLKRDCCCGTPCRHVSRSK